MDTAKDRLGYPLAVGDRVTWGAGGVLVVGSIIEINPKPETGRWSRGHAVKTTVTTEPEDKRRGRGGWEWTANIIKIPPDTKPVTLWCEYDIGQEGMVFASEEAAWAWAETHIDMDSFDHAGTPMPVDEFIEDLFANGLIGVKEVTLA